MATNSDWKIRVRHERAALETKIDALERLLASRANVDIVGPAQVELMRSQLAIMRSYWTLLSCRLAIS